MLTKKFLIALMGTVVEYYDYALYGFTAAILADQFFPLADPTIALIYTFGIFAIGSCAKPLGALIFGYLGDNKGRRYALRLSMIGIAIPTTIVGLLPGYEQWGWASPLILLICRFMQGLFVAGEYDGVSIYILEHVSEKKACLANSLIGIAFSAGIYMASLFVALSQLPRLPDWSWRLPFLFAGALGIVTMYLRRYLTETPAFINNHQAKATPLITLFKHHRQQFLITVLICGAAGGSYHFYLVFWNTYLFKVLGLYNLSTAALNTSYMALFYMMSKPLAGLVGDKLGPLNLLKIAPYPLIIMICLNGYMLYWNQIYLSVLVLTAIAITFFGVAGYVVIIQLHNVTLRYQGISLGHATASILFSGSTPLISMYLWNKTHNKLAPLACFLIFPCMMLVAAKLAEDLRSFPADFKNKISS